MDKEINNQPHGGKRKNAGRKKVREVTTKQKQIIIKSYQKMPLKELALKTRLTYYQLQNEIVQMKKKGLLEKNALISIRKGKVVPARQLKYNVDNMGLALIQAQKFYNKQLKDFINACTAKIKRD